MKSSLLLTPQKNYESGGCILTPVSRGSNSVLRGRCSLQKDRTVPTHARSANLAEPHTTVRE